MADEWIVRIEAQGISEELLNPPLPDRFTLASMAARARDMVEGRPGLAEEIARALLLFAVVVPGSRKRPDALPTAAWLILAIVQRLRGELDEAEALHRQIRAHFSSGHWDPLAEAELCEEEAEVCAARGRYREAISKARKALREYSAPYVKPWLREALLRKIALWAQAAEVSG